MYFRVTKSVFIITFFLTFIFFQSTAYAKHLLVYGDSLSAAYGMEQDQGWVSLLDQSLSLKDHTVSNASISGETSGGGLSRLALSLSTFSPDVVLIALGANDGLRGYPTSVLEDNLTQMILLVKDSGAIPVIAGISLPPSYGPRYIDQFSAVFPRLAAEKNIDYIDIFRDDFFTTPGFIQNDGLHPTPITQPIIRDLIEDFLFSSDLLN